MCITFMEIISKGPDKYSYSDIKNAFRSLWVNKGVPIDLRLYMCGAVYQAGVRQGDEVFPREIFELILRGEELTQAQLVSMVENVHKFVLIQDRLREQYLFIVVRMVVGYLDKQAQHARKSVV